MGQATIFAGQKIKTLKSTLNLNGGADVISSTVDPTSVATSAEPGSLLLNTTSGKLYRKNDSGSSTNWSEVGSGGSGINYISNPSAATNTTGWATYADAAGAQPVDGTGGSPNVTWTRSTTTPLRGSADFNFAKDAANRQGEGVSTDLTIDLADQAKVLTVTFDYEVLSGTYADGDLTVYLIADPTGTPVVIQPAGYVVQNATVGTKMKQIATFQTQATGQSYRLCFHVASVSASAYTLAIDNVVVGPQVVQYGAPVTDWQSYTPTLGFTNTTGVVGKWRRVGQDIECDVFFSLSAGPAGVLTASIPTQFQIDTTTLASSTFSTGVLGIAQMERVSSRMYTALLQYAGAQTVRAISTDITPSPDYVTPTSPTTWQSGDRFNLKFKAPISGWSSTVQMSNDTDTRVVAARYENGSQAIGNPAPITAASKIVDTHNAFSGSTFTVPVSGIYECAFKGYSTASPFVAATQAHSVRIYKNGANQGDVAVYIANAAGTVFEFLQGSVIVPANAGDTLQFYGVNNGVAFSMDGIALDFKRLSGPSAIAASETVRARVVMSANQSFGISVFYPNLNVKTYDSHNAMSASGVFTAPISGVYSVKMSLGSDGTATFPTTQGFDIGIEKNGTTLISQLGISYGNGSTNINQVIGSDSIYLNAGETIRMRCSSGVAFTASASFRTFFAVERVGN